MTDPAQPIADDVLAPPVARLRRPLDRPGRGIRAFARMHMMGAIFPFAVGLVLYGWRAPAITGIVIASTLVGMSLWRRVTGRGANMHFAQGVWLAGLLSLMLPAHLLALKSPVDGSPQALWAIVPAAGLLLAMAIWVFGGTAGIHPVIAAYLPILVLFGPALTPHWVLERHKLVAGDLGDYQALDALPPGSEGWVFGPPTRHDSLYIPEPAASRLNWLRVKTSLEDRRPHFRASISLDDLPPLEDLMVGGHPSPIGTGSAVAVIIGGLFLLYRGLIDWRIPLLICVAAFAALLLLPLPFAIVEGGVPWRSLLLDRHVPALSTAITFVNYEVMSSPLLFCAFYLATSPPIRPMARRGRVAYALVAGVLMAGAMLYVSVPHGPYIALAAASLLTPLLDRWFGARPVV